MNKRAAFELTAALATVLALGACAGMCPKEQPAPPKTVDTACTWAKPIQVTEADTLATRKLALGAWQTWHDNCDQQLKAKPFSLK